MGIVPIGVDDLCTLFYMDVFIVQFRSFTQRVENNSVDYIADVSIILGVLSRLLLLRVSNSIGLLGASNGNSNLRPELLFVGDQPRCGSLPSKLIRASDPYQRNKSSGVGVLPLLSQYPLPLGWIQR